MKNITPRLGAIRAASVQAAFLVSTCTAVMFLAGCSSEPESHVVSAPPPSTPPPATAPAATTTVVETPPTSGSGSPSAAATTPVIVTQAPPVVPQEPVLERPSPKHIWIPGYWSYRDSHYVWIAGRWEIPPSSGAVWVAPRWQQESNGYRYFEGYWK